MGSEVDGARAEVAALSLKLKQALAAAQKAAEEKRRSEALADTKGVSPAP